MSLATDREEYPADQFVPAVAERLVREAIEALNPDEQTYMATLVLGGWRFIMKHFASGPRKWVAMQPSGTGYYSGPVYAPTLFSLLGYIERRIDDRS